MMIEHHHEGVLVYAAEVDLVKGTITETADGKTTDRPLTDGEVAAYTPPDPTPDPLSVLLADLAKATSLAQVRAAAANALTNGG